MNTGKLNDRRIWAERYDRLMGENEEETVRTLTVYRNAMADLIQQFRGWVRNR